MVWLNRSSWSSNLDVGISRFKRFPNLCRPMLKLFRFPPSVGLTVFIVFLLASGAVYRLFLQSLRWDAKPEFEVRAINPSKGPADPPVFAYWISGTGGDGRRILRLLKAVYHPRNHYLLHLDAGSTDSERRELARSIESESLFRAFRNVDVIGKAYAVDWTGSSVVAATLHGAAVLLKVSKYWDWFITLSASDYPIVTQDDLLHAFSALPRDLNFLDHTSDLGWKETARFDRIAMDPSLFMSKNGHLSYASETRKTPDAFTIFTGSPWLILSRAFVEHCVHGWDNLPRQLLMYFANVPYASESYFQTAICNSPQFQNTTVNNDLRYFVWDDPPQLEPHFLNQSDYWRMRQSGAAFARKFLEGDSVLQKMDQKILRRSPEGVGLGKWCSSQPGNQPREELAKDPCSSWGDINTVEPGPSGKKLKRLLSKIVAEKRLHSNQCKVPTLKIPKM